MSSPSSTPSSPATDSNFTPTPFKVNEYIHFHSLCIQRKQKFKGKYSVYYFEDVPDEQPQSLRVFATKHKRTPYAHLLGHIETSKPLPQDSNTIFTLGVCFRDGINYHVPNKDDQGFHETMSRVPPFDTPEYSDMLTSSGFFTKLGMVEMVDRKTATETCVRLKFLEDQLWNEMKPPQQSNENGQVHPSTASPNNKTTPNDPNNHHYLFNSSSIFCFSLLSNHIRAPAFTLHLNKKCCYSLSFALFERNTKDNTYTRVSNTVGNFRLIMTHSGAKSLYTTDSLRTITKVSSFESVLDKLRESSNATEGITASHIPGGKKGTVWSSNGSLSIRSPVRASVSSSNEQKDDSARRWKNGEKKQKENAVVTLPTVSAMVGRSPLVANGGSNRSIYEPRNNNYLGSEDHAPQRSMQETREQGSSSSLRNRPTIADTVAAHKGEHLQHAHVHHAGYSPLPGTMGAGHDALGYVPLYEPVGSSHTTDAVSTGSSSQELSRLPLLMRKKKLKKRSNS